MIRAALGARYRVHATAANFNNLIGVPLTILAAPEDNEALVLEAGARAAGAGDSSARERPDRPRGGTARRRRPRRRRAGAGGCPAARRARRCPGDRPPAGD